jgi:hypothetical protein
MMAIQAGEGDFLMKAKESLSKRMVRIFTDN